MYQQLPKHPHGYDNIKRVNDDGSVTFIPFCVDNTDYQRFKQDLANGAELLDAEGNVVDGKEFIMSIENPQPVEEKELTPSDSYAEALATVQSQRAVAYPPIADYLDAIVKGDQNQLDTFIAKCQAVKLKYPKP